MQRHALDLKRAQVAGQHLFAANDPLARDPKAEPRFDPKIEASDRAALELQIRQQPCTEWRHQ